MDFDKIFEDFDEDETEYINFKVGDKIKAKCDLDYWNSRRGARNDGYWKTYTPKVLTIKNIKNAVEVHFDDDDDYDSPVMDINDKTKVCTDTLFMLEGTWCWYILDETKIEKV